MKCAIAVGGDLIGHKGESGVITSAALADLFLVDGDRLQVQSVVVGRTGSR